MEEPFWTFSYRGRPSINEDFFRLEADFSFGNFTVVPDIRRGFFYRSIILSPYYSLMHLEAAKRLYRVSHWL